MTRFRLSWQAVLVVALAGQVALLPVTQAQSVPAPTDGSTIQNARGRAPQGTPGGQVVSGNTGSATHGLPITVAPGVSGLQPRIALSYSSHGAGQESWAGSGWSVGLGSIARSLKNGVPKYDNGQDALLYNGQELIYDAGTYRTRRESFLDIRGDAVPGWEVRSKDGTVSRFGASGGALNSNCIIDNPTPGLTDSELKWLLCEVEDVHGNLIRVEYDRADAGSAYIKKITYGTSTDLNRSVEFTSESRPDVSESYRAGFLQVMAKRLLSIDIKADDLLIRRYKLNYVQSPDSTRSLLDYVETFGADADDLVPTTPFVTKFAYHSNVTSGTTGWQLATAGQFDWGVPFSLVNSDSGDNGVRIADIDGDARPDLVKGYATFELDENDPNSSVVTMSADSGVYLNDGSGFSSVPDAFWTLPETGYPILDPYFAIEVDGESWSIGRMLVDMTGDGRADVIGGSQRMNDIPRTIGGYSYQGGEWFLMATEPWFKSSTSGWDPVFHTLNNGIFTTAKMSVSLEGAPKVMTVGGDTRFADLTGDGLPELIARGVKNHYRVHCNGIAWQGFCLTDLVHSCLPGAAALGVSYVVYNDGDFNFSYPTMYQSTSTVPSFDRVNEAPCLATILYSPDFSPCTNFTSSACTSTLYHSMTFPMSLDTENNWRFDTNFDLGNLPIDVNADGLADVVTAYEDQGLDRRLTRLNNGNKAFVDAPAWSLPTGVDLYRVPSRDDDPPEVYSKDRGVRLADVNGDGHIDVVQAIQGGARATWLGDGDAGANDGDDQDPWVASSAWELPTGLSFVNDSGQDQGVRLMDVDGDGMTDVVSSKDGTNQVYLNRGSVPDLLTKVTNRFGGVTSIEYSPSSSFDNTGTGSGTFEDDVPDLPQIMQVVSKVSMDDLRNPLNVTTFLYSDGLYDTDEKEFRGFRWVDRRDMDTDGVTPLRRTVTWFHQDIAKAGLRFAHGVYEGIDVIWSYTTWNYTDNTVPPFDALPSYVSLPNSVSHYEVNGTSGDASLGTLARRAYTQYDYDIYGNLSGERYRGEWETGVGDVTPNDDRSVERVYAAPNTTDYIVDHLSTERVRAGSNPSSGAILRETEYYYDNGALGALPIKGLLTKQIARLHDAAIVDPETTFGYDSYGNPTTMTVPRGNAGEISLDEGTTTTTYDSVFHSFPVSVENGLEHLVEYFYNTHSDCSSIAGAMSSYPAGTGVAQQQQGPNDTGDSRPYHCVDAHGRPVLDVASEGLAKTEWQYDDAWTASPFDPVSVTTRQMVDVGAAPALQNIQRLDGLGRPYETERDGPLSNAVYTTIKYDALGRVAETSNPRFLAETPLYNKTTYDVLDHPVQIERPGTGRISSAEYQHQSVTIEDPPGVFHNSIQIVSVSTDANDNVVKRGIDTFGNVIEVIEEGEEGVGLLGGPYKTTYVYDLLNQLVAVTDHQGNTTTIGYDLLGRRQSVQDPDTGMTTFSHDPNGNVREEASELATSTWIHDALDRPARYQGGAGFANVVTWKYDTAPKGKGLLQSRSDNFANVAYAVLQYDSAGRATSERYTVGSAQHRFDTSYGGLGQLLTRQFPREESCGSPDPRTIEWVHDNDGYMTEIRSEGLAFASSIEWDAQGRLSRWTAGNGIKTETDFSPATDRYDEFRVRLPGGQLVEHLKYGFDPGDRIISVHNELDQSMSDPLDRMYYYDGLNRLITADGPFGANQGFVSQYFYYDPIGNLTCRASTSDTGCLGPDSIALTYPSPLPAPGVVRPHAPTQVDGSPVAYDDAGNLEALNARTYVYDVRGKLKTALDSGSVTRAFKFDMDGRLSHISGGGIDRALITDDFEWDRVDNEASVHLSLGGAVVATLHDGYEPKRWKKIGCGGGYRCALMPLWMMWYWRRRYRRREQGKLGKPFLPTVTFLIALVFTLPLSLEKLFVSSAEATPPQSVTYYHGDHLGSSVLTSDDGGTVSKQTYRPYGEVVPASAGGSTDAPLFGFTGQRFEEGLGIYDYGARWYDPVLGRFLQPDSIVPDPMDPQSLNRYTYVRNNPVNRVDPSGNDDYCIFGCGETYLSFYDDEPQYDDPLYGFLGDVSLSESLGWDVGWEPASSSFDLSSSSGWSSPEFVPLFGAPLGLDQPIIPRVIDPPRFNVTPLNKSGRPDFSRTTSEPARTNYNSSRPTPGATAFDLIGLANDFGGLFLPGHIRSKIDSQVHALTLDAYNGRLQFDPGRDLYADVAVFYRDLVYMQAFDNVHIRPVQPQSDGVLRPTEYLLGDGLFVQRQYPVLIRPADGSSGLGQRP